MDEIICAKCNQLLQPGAGELYTITIEATSDPYPPHLPESDTDEIRREIERILDQMQSQSDVELKNQVRRRLVLHLCVSCYNEWIESPVG